MKLHKVYKKIGQTPLEALEGLRKKKKIPASVSLTYAGRLDPMAEGLLLILEGATKEDREKYLGLDKVYEAKMLLGLTTDTWDLLGIPKFTRGVILRLSASEAEESQLKKISIILKKYKGTCKLPVPAYSSIQYKGKSLFEWARAGKISERQLPLREMKVASVKLQGVKHITPKQLIKYIQTNIKKVKGDFRQEEILEGWRAVIPFSFPSLQGRGKGRVLDPGSILRMKLRRTRSGAGMTIKFLIVNLKLSVGSGTYIRSIAHDLGKKLKTGGVLFSLKRTRVGKFK